MKFTVTSIAALIALVQAIEITNEEFNLAPGEPFAITWQNAEGPVTINLRYGDPNNLEMASQIVANVDGDAGTYTWQVPDDLVSRSNYVLQVVDSVDDNYSIPFPLEGSGEETTTSAPTSTATSTASSTSSEASTTSESVSSSASSDEPTSTESKSATSTKSESASQTSEDSNSTGVPDSKAGRLGSPVALIFTLAAMLYFL